MSLYVSGHYPAINQQNVPRNPTIKVTFDQELVTSSINYRVISVHDSLYATIPGTAGWDYSNRGTTSGIANILTFTPTVLLDSNKKYTVYVHKEPDSVISKWNDSVADTYKFTFYTGEGTVEVDEPTVIEQLYIDLQKALDEENYSEAAKIQELIDQYESGTIPSGEVPEEEVVEVLNVTSTYPINEQSNVKNLKFIEVEFNDVLNSSGIALGDYISVAYKNVLQ